jgi:hypothetical protein
MLFLINFLLSNVAYALIFDEITYRFSIQAKKKKHTNTKYISVLNKLNVPSPLVLGGNTWWLTISQPT